MNIINDEIDKWIIVNHAIKFFIVNSERDNWKLIRERKWHKQWNISKMSYCKGNVFGFNF